MNEQSKMGDEVSASMLIGAGCSEVCEAPGFTMKFECFDADGNLKWTEEGHNTVMNAGKTDIIDKYFKGAAYTAAWYLGLKGTGVEVVGDTLASHASWAEVNPYAGNRPQITFGTTAAGSNTATAVSYAITGSATVAGAFVCNVASGTGGVLYSAKDFAASRAVQSGDTLNVTLTVSAT
jgi:hypothetical protein